MSLMAIFNEWLSISTTVNVHILSLPFEDLLVLLVSCLEYMY